MSVYEYVALDEKGRQCKGFIDATGVAAARQKLREEGVYPVEISQTQQKKDTLLSGIFDVNLWQKVSAKEISVFTRQLSTLLGAGIPLVPSFSILLAQTKNTLLRKILAQIRGDLNEGKSLTVSMENFPRVFPPFYINMVKAGEASGTINLVLSAAAIVVVRYVMTGTDAGKRFWDNVRLKAPILGAINLKIAIARFSRTLATLLQSGVPLLSAMDIVRNVVNNIFIGETISKAAKEVEEGQGLAGPLTQSGIFPPMVTEMIAVGEQSGSLEKMLNRVATTYETEAQSDIMVMTSLLEPLMILAMGLIVGFIVVSILLPIFEMNQMVK